MLNVTMAVLASWIVLRYAPDTPVGRLLFRLLVEAPSARLSRITRGDVIVCVVVLVGVAMIAFTEDGAKIRMATVAVPDIGVWLTTFEFSAYLDIATVLVATVSSMRWRTAAAQIAGRVRRMVGALERPRVPRARALRPRKSAANDDEGGPVVTRAA